MRGVVHLENEVIENYQRDEKMMILIFAQWCINHNLDPKQVYEQAYPNQKNNTALNDAIEHTVTKEESDYIATDTLLAVLSMFGNEELAFVISEMKKG
ncbi:hypothetical protein DS745_02740 [Anaerobacillus alkaliphilus]|uniref:Uncharacterized protein n=1 Tax=Anaerobacillus alkaliphilus TaxID=1548597 RepID=A0A4Q0VZ70_9BACI|nr:hypothetical protein [Anaerobacillus alkaliphilus]RXJ04642.1 hypothetical protein DS745_02740 [Anaerobacillus alkaliphilus]